MIKIKRGVYCRFISLLYIVITSIIFELSLTVTVQYLGFIKKFHLMKNQLYTVLNIHEELSSATINKGKSCAVLNRMNGIGGVFVCAYLVNCIVPGPLQRKEYQSLIIFIKFSKLTVKLN